MACRQLGLSGGIGVVIELSNQTGQPDTAEGYASLSCLSPAYTSLYQCTIDEDDSPAPFVRLQCSRPSPGQHRMSTRYMHWDIYIAPFKEPLKLGLMQFNLESALSALMTYNSFQLWWRPQLLCGKWNRTDLHMGAAFRCCMVHQNQVIIRSVSIWSVHENKEAAYGR